MSSTPNTTTERAAAQGRRFSPPALVRTLQKSAPKVGQSAPECAILFFEIRETRKRGGTKYGRSCALNRAMAYLEAHMEDDGAAADVSSVTTYSPYHFGRLFYYVAGMPLSEYIRKRRLSLAAMRLQSGNERVLDLALLYGYDSADSFTRAFVRQHGCTPSEARKPGAQLTLFPSLVFQIQIKGVEAMHWRMEERDAFEVFGIERRIGCEDNGAVPAFWTECHQDGAMKDF